MHRFCVILHNMKNPNFKQSYLTHFARYDLKIFTHIRQYFYLSLCKKMSMSFKCPCHEMKLTHYHQYHNAFGSKTYNIVWHDFQVQYASLTSIPLSYIA